MMTFSWNVHKTAADEHYLVTGNVKDFPASWASTQIVTARQFLDAVV